MAVLGMLLKTPFGPPLSPVEDFVHVAMDDLGFLSEEIEARETVVTARDSRALDWDRLRDANDSYSSILVDPNR
jgi:hypothetical protein